MPDNLNAEQYDKLKIFKAWAMKQGLIQTYDTIDDFRERLRHQLPIMLGQHPYLAQIGKPIVDATIKGETVRTVNISEEAAMLLKAAASGGGHLLMIRSMNGLHVQAGSEMFGDPEDRRSMARWKAAADQLISYGLISDISHKGESFEVTHQGYEALDQIPDLAPMNDSEPDQDPT